MQALQFTLLTLFFFIIVTDCIYIVPIIYQMCLCLIILISSTTSKNIIFLYIYFYKCCKHLVSLGLFYRAQIFYCPDNSLELVFWFSPFHTLFVLHYLFLSHLRLPGSAKCIARNQRIQGVGRLPCMWGEKTGKFVKKRCGELGMEGGKKHSYGEKLTGLRFLLREN